MNGSGLSQSQTPVSPPPSSSSTLLGSLTITASPSTPVLNPSTCEVNPEDTEVIATGTFASPVPDYLGNSSEPYMSMQVYDSSGANVGRTNSVRMASGATSWQVSLIPDQGFPPTSCVVALYWSTNQGYSANSSPPQ